MTEKIITIIVILIFVSCLVFGVTQCQRLVDWMDNPENPVNIEHAKRYKAREDAKIKWCRDQNGLAKFDAYNQYKGCEIK